jgi:alpha-mannosidase
MHDDSVLVERRIRRELMERLMPAMYSASVPMQVEAWDTPGEPVSYTDAMAAMATEARPFAIGSKWSRPWGTTWFRFTADVPRRLGRRLAGGRHRPRLPPRLGRLPERGSGVGTGRGREGRAGAGHSPAPHRAAAAPRRPGPLEIVVEAASNPAFPQSGTRFGHLGSLSTAGDKPLYSLRQASLAVRDDEVYHLLLDIEACCWA